MAILYVGIDLAKNACPAGDGWSRTGGLVRPSVPCARLTNGAPPCGPSPWGLTWAAWPGLPGHLSPMEGW